MPNKLPLVILSLYLCLSHRLELFFSSSHHCLCSICHYATSIWSLFIQINFIIAISIRLSTQISIGLPLSHWDKSYHYPSLLLNLYWTLGQVYRLHPLLLTAQLGHPPIGWHHPHLTIYSDIEDIMLLVRQGSGENLMELLAVKTSRVGWRGVGQWRGHCRWVSSQGGGSRT